MLCPGFFGIKRSWNLAEAGSDELHAQQLPTVKTVVPVPDLPPLQCESEPSLSRSVPAAGPKLSHNSKRRRASSCYGVSLDLPETRKCLQQPSSRHKSDPPHVDAAWKGVSCCQC